MGWDQGAWCGAYCGGCSSLLESTSSEETMASTTVVTTSSEPETEPESEPEDETSPMPPASPSQCARAWDACGATDFATWMLRRAIAKVGLTTRGVAHPWRRCNGTHPSHPSSWAWA